MDKSRIEYIGKELVLDIFLCRICNDPITVPVEHKIQGCHRFFCYDCILFLMENKVPCPLCKKDIKDSDTDLEVNMNMFYDVYNHIYIKCTTCDTQYPTNGKISETQTVITIHQKSCKNLSKDEIIEQLRKQVKEAEQQMFEYESKFSKLTQRIIEMEKESNIRKSYRMGLIKEISDKLEKKNAFIKELSEKLDKKNENHKDNKLYDYSKYEDLGDPFPSSKFWGNPKAREYNAFYGLYITGDLTEINKETKSKMKSDEKIIKRIMYEMETYNGSGHNNCTSYAYVVSISNYGTITYCTMMYNPSSCGGITLSTFNNEKCGVHTKHKVVFLDKKIPTTFFESLCVYDYLIPEKDGYNNSVPASVYNNINNKKTIKSITGRGIDIDKQFEFIANLLQAM